MNVTKELGTIEDVAYLVAELNSKNISLILDLPLYPFYSKLQPASENFTKGDSDVVHAGDEYVRIERSIIDDNKITNVIKFWLRLGVSGFYLKGLEYFTEDQYLMENIREWKAVMGRDNILIVNESLFEKINDDLADEILECVDLVDVFLDISNGTQSIEHQVIKTLNGKLKPRENGPWIHWSLNGIEKRRMATTFGQNSSLAAVVMSLMLPGNPSIFYGDELSLGSAHDPSNEHAETKHLHHLPTMPFTDQSVKLTASQILPWLPKSITFSYDHLQYIMDACALRMKSPALFMNSINKDENIHGNTHIRANKDDLLIVERTYPRRHTFISITNLGTENLSLDISAFYYSGQLVLGPARGTKVFFNNFKIASMETIIVKLDK